MNRTDIELASRELQRGIWGQRETLIPGSVLSVRDVVTPSIAALYLGLDYQEYPDLGNFGYRGERFSIAGLIDRNKKKIAVSTRFSDGTVRFTAAHEIGHWVLHPGEVHLHRDRPIGGITSQGRSELERDADYFAACFLIPKKQLVHSMQLLFGAKLPFRIDEAAAFHLSPHDPEALLRYDENAIQSAVAVASARSFGNRRFDSLAQQFGVSISTMAIRLNELELIEV